MAAPLHACVTTLGLLQSASTRRPEDNAHMESFFHSLKAELIRGVSFRDVCGLRRELKRYVKYYNARRMH